MKGETDLSYPHVADETGSVSYVSDPVRDAYFSRTVNFLRDRWKILVATLSILFLVASLPIAQSVGSVSSTLILFAALSVVPAGVIAFRVRKMGDKKAPVAIVSASVSLGVVAVGFAYVTSRAAMGYFEMGSFLTMGVLFYVVVAPVEEVFKLLAVYIYPTDTRYFDTATDVAVFGAFAGLGFAGAENALYFVTEGFDMVTLEAFVGRMLVAPVHVILSSIAGYYLGVALLNKHRRKRAALVLLKGIVLVVFLHGTHNAVVTYLPAAVALSPLPDGFGFRVTNLVFLSGFYCATWYVLRNLLGDKDSKEDDLQLHGFISAQF